MNQKYDVVRLRSRLGLSQEKFAEKLGVSVSSVTKWDKIIVGSHFGFEISSLIHSCIPCVPPH